MQWLDNAVLDYFFVATILKSNFMAWVKEKAKNKKKLKQHKDNERPWPFMTIYVLEFL